MFLRNFWSVEHNAFGFADGCQAFSFNRFYKRPSRLFHNGELYSSNAVDNMISMQFIANDDWWEET